MSQFPCGMQGSEYQPENGVLCLALSRCLPQDTLDPELNRWMRGHDHPGHPVHVARQGGRLVRHVIYLGIRSVVTGVGRSSGASGTTGCYARLSHLPSKACSSNFRRRSALTYSSWPCRRSSSVGSGCLAPKLPANSRPCPKRFIPLVPLVGPRETGAEVPGLDQCLGFPITLGEELHQGVAFSDGYPGRHSPEPVHGEPVLIRVSEPNQNQVLNRRPEVLESDRHISFGDDLSFRLDMVTSGVMGVAPKPGVPPYSLSESSK